MVVRVCFDVHGANEAEIRDAAIEELAAFTSTNPIVVVEEWEIDIEVHQEAVAVSGGTALWRGEVTARDDR